MPSRASINSTFTNTANKSSVSKFSATIPKTVANTVVKAYKPIVYSGMIIATASVIFPQETLYQFLLTTKTWQSHSQINLETRQFSTSTHQQSELIKQHNKLAHYDIKTSSQMVFLPNNRYQKVTLINYTNPNLKSSQFEYLESGSWSISGKYIEANPNNIIDSSLSNQIIKIMQRNNLLNIKAKQTYRMYFNGISNATLINLSFRPSVFH